MRRSLALAMIVLVAGTIAAAPLAFAEKSGGPKLVIAVLLRASGGDAISACQDGPIANPKQIANLLDQNFMLSTIRGSGSLEDNGRCVAFHAAEPLTRHAFGRARSIRITLTLQSLADSYSEVTLVVCTPLLESSAKVFAGSQPSPAAGCRFNGYQWDALQPLDLSITFDAAPGDLARSALGVIAWVFALGMLVAFARLSGWRLAPTGSIASTLGVLAISAAALEGWVQVAYYSHLLHYLQLVAHIGEAGGALVLALPGVLSAAAVFFAGMRYLRRSDAISASAPAERSGSDIPIPEDDTILAFAQPPQRPRSLFVALVPPIAFALAYLLFVVYVGGTEIKVEGMIATLLAYVFVAQFFSRNMLPHIHAAVPVPAARRDSILAELRTLHATQRTILVSTLPPAASPYGGAIYSVGDQVTIWKPLMALPDDEIAGAIALRAAHSRRWPVALALLLSTIALSMPSGGHIPFLVIVLPVALLVSIGFRDVISSIRTTARVVSSGKAEDYIRGMLTAARTTARLAAAGSLGIFGIKAPTYAASYWARTVKLANKLASDAKIPPERVARIAQEIRWKELGDLSGTPDSHDGPHSQDGPDSHDAGAGEISEISARAPARRARQPRP